MAFDRSSYNKQYQAAKYDRLGVYLPKGMRQPLELLAKESGMTLNGYIVACLKAAIDDQRRLSAHGDSTIPAAEAPAQEGFNLQSALDHLNFGYDFSDAPTDQEDEDETFDFENCGNPGATREFLESYQEAVGKRKQQLRAIDEDEEEGLPF